MTFGDVIVCLIVGGLAAVMFKYFGLLGVLTVFLAWCVLTLMDRGDE